MQVVLFHVPPKTQKQVAQLLRPYGISVRTVSREQYTTPLGVLLGLRKAGRVLPSLGLEFAEPMLLMHGLPDDMVDAVLAQLKAAKISIDLKDYHADNFGMERHADVCGTAARAGEIFCQSKISKMPAEYPLAFVCIKQLEKFVKSVKMMRVTLL